MNLDHHLYNKHANCKVAVTYDYKPKRSKYKLFHDDGMPSGKIALVCCDHNKWIKWLSKQEAQAIEELQ